MHKKVLLNIGHPERKGAEYRGTNEHDVNSWQALFLQRELCSFGISATILEQNDDDDLYSLGKKAEGYDAFVSLHLNASVNHKANYSCCLVHPKHQHPASLSTTVASAWAQEIANILQIPCYSGDKGYPKGVMPVGLSILSGAAKTSCPIYFLSEIFFIEAYGTKQIMMQKCDTAMKVAAGILAGYCI